MLTVTKHPKLQDTLICIDDARLRILIRDLEVLDTKHKDLASKELLNHLKNNTK